MPRATAPLASLSQKLVKSRHCLHAQELQCESSRTECEKSKQTVEENDAQISAMEEQERKLKMQYVEAKLAYEKMHALKYSKQQDLKNARASKLSVSKENDSLAGQSEAKRCEWTKAHDEHMRLEKQARTLSDKMEAVEKDKENQKRRCQKARDDIVKYEKMHDMLKRELDVIAASAANV